MKKPFIYIRLAMSFKCLKTTCLSSPRLALQPATPAPKTNDQTHHKYTTTCRFSPAHTRGKEKRGKVTKHSQAAHCPQNSSDHSLSHQEAPELSPLQQRGLPMIPAVLRRLCLPWHGAVQRLHPPLPHPELIETASFRNGNRAAAELFGHHQTNTGAVRVACKNL